MCEVCLDGEAGGNRQGRQCSGGKPGKPPLTALLLSLSQFVVADTQHAGQQLELGILLAVAYGPGIRGDGFGALAGQLAIFADAKAQRFREALLAVVFRFIARVGFTIDDQAQDPVAASEALERQNLLVDPT